MMLMPRTGGSGTTARRSDTSIGMRASDFVFSHERPTRGTFVEGPRESMIGVVAHNLAKCGEVVSQIEFGIGIVVVATGTAVLTTVVTSVTATSVITFALLTLVALEADGDLLACSWLGSWLLVLLLLGGLLFFFFGIWIAVDGFLLPH